MKKNMKKMLSLLLGLVMIIAMATTVMAAVTVVSEKGGNATITITLPEDANNKNTYTYNVYKVFDATSDGSSDAVSYTVMNGKTGVPEGFEVDTAGNVLYKGTGSELSDAEIAAIAAYVNGDAAVATGSAESSDGTLIFTNLEYGYYYITTTTGTAVTVDSTNPNAEVKDKNEVPTVDKKITGANSLDSDGKKALAEVGTTVNFEATIDVKVGAENYVFHDVMTSGLNYDPKSLSVKVLKADGTVADVDAANYDTTIAARDTITIAFNNDYIKTVIGEQIVITYAATVTNEAITVNAEKNTASVSYGNGGTINSTPTSDVEIYNAKFTVKKQDGDEKPLAGAGFVIQNADKKYYQYDEGTKTIKWVDDIDDATEHVSKEDGSVDAFVGLANGAYTLIEKTVPAGYNKADDEKFEIKEHDYTVDNLEQSATVTNKAGTELPSTGGVGTTLFYVFGMILVIGAGILLVTRRRMAK